MPCQFSDAGSFTEGIAKVTINGKDHLIDKTGKIVY
ncbi:MAG: WG repeat-containing protein [Dolichospermum sp.]